VGVVVQDDVPGRARARHGLAPEGDGGALECLGPGHRHRGSCARCFPSRPRCRRSRRRRRRRCPGLPRGRSSHSGRCRSRSPHWGMESTGALARPPVAAGIVLVAGRLYRALPAWPSVVLALLEEVELLIGAPTHIADHRPLAAAAQWRRRLRSPTPPPGDPRGSSPGPGHLLPGACTLHTLAKVATTGRRSDHRRRPESPCRGRARVGGRGGPAAAAAVPRAVILAPR